MAGVALFFATFLQATFFAEAIREYAAAAAADYVSYIRELSDRFNSDTPRVTVQEMRETFGPPGLVELGRSIFNLVMRCLLLGFVGALVGVLRGRFGPANGPSGDLKPKESNS